MAKLTSTQKKSRSSFIALIIAIILVAAASFYVIFDGITSKSDLFENTQMAKAFASVLDKGFASFVSEDDLSSVKYLEISYNQEQGQYGVGVGYDDFMTEYDLYVQQQEAYSEASLKKSELEEKEKEAEENGQEIVKESESIVIPEITADPSGFIKSEYFTTSDKLSFDALKYFTSVEVLSLGNVTIDTSVLKNLAELKSAFFNTNGITDVTDFASLNFEKIQNLSFSGNNITDWSLLEPYADKVSLIQYIPLQQQDGTVYNYPLTYTLTEYLASLEQAQEETTEETSEQTTEQEQQ